MCDQCTMDADMYSNHSSIAVCEIQQVIISFLKFWSHDIVCMVLLMNISCVCLVMLQWKILDYIARLHLQCMCKSH